MANPEAMTKTACTNSTIVKSLEHDEHRAPDNLVPSRVPSLPRLEFLVGALGIAVAGAELGAGGVGWALAAKPVHLDEVNRASPRKLRFRAYMPFATENAFEAIDS